MRHLAISFACLVALLASPLQAQTSQAQTAPLWEIHLNLQKTFASPLGQWGMAMLEKEQPEAIEKITDFVEAIGLDPRTEIGEVVIYGNGFEETDATVIANLGQSTGNLEGWMLAAPGYKSEDLDANTLLHSYQFDKSAHRSWCALPKTPQDGDYVFVASFVKEKTVKLAQQVLAGNQAPVPNALSGKSIFSFIVNDFSSLPIDINENDPGSAILKIIDSLAVNLASDAENLEFAVDITASSAGKARQIGQLLQGLKALLQLATDEDADIKKVATLLEGLVVKQNEGEPNVQASLTTPYALIEKLVKE